MDVEDIREQVDDRARELERDGHRGPPVDAEAWYRRAVEFYRADLEHAAGKPIPEFHISSGFTDAGQRVTKVAGECFSPGASADKRAQIFLNPRYVEPLQLLNTVVHEVIHATVGNEHGHRKGFSKVAAAVGMCRPWTATRWRPGDGMIKAELVVAALGPFPRAAFVGAKPKQPTRLLKAVCPGCGCVVRITRVWADAGLPLCGTELTPKCGKFELVE
jgi:hypothetical protein